MSTLDLFPADAALTDPTRGEYARTPRWLVSAALRLVPAAMRPREVLDLGAGLGDLAEAAVAYYGSSIELVTAVEREPDRAEDIQRRHADWSVITADVELWASRQGKRDLWPLIVCNPPFTRDLQWVQLALPLLTPDGALVVISPLEHLGGMERWLGLYRDRPPAVVGISPRRPRGAGWDDARAIACAVWAPGVVKMPGTRLVWMEVPA